MLRRSLALVALLAACSPFREHRPVSLPVSTSASPSVGTDVHSYAHPEQVAVARIELALEVSFDARTIDGVATFEIRREDRRAPLSLDTRDLVITKVENAGGEVPPQWQLATWTLSPRDARLGSALRVTLGDDTTRVRVSYRSGADASGLQWLAPAQTADGVAPFLYSQSQAIHARSWFPCQDSPAVRAPYRASVRVPAGMRALMSADPVGGDPSKGEFEFAMDLPVPSYLVALAVGRLEFAELGPRTGVWAEPSVLVGARSELGDLERMLAAIESSYGSYRWGRYDVLVLPPAFPFGGMENPKLTFATPTILAGDRSLMSLIVHELAHSWSGNLVTNASWEDLWLNEGFTVYIERRIVEGLYGRERADMEAVLGRQDLDEALAELGADDQRLRLQLTDRDPDDALSDVAYEKGALLLRALEQAYGREVFDPFLQSWFDGHAFGSVTTEQFEAFVAEQLVALHQPLPGRTAVELGAWLDRPGVPADAPVATAEAFVRVDATVARFVAGETGVDALPSARWSPYEWLHFLRALPRELPSARLAELDRRYGLTGSGNSEILAQWLEVCVLRGYTEVDGRLEAFLQKIGRRKFLLPLYRALLDTGRKHDAERIYASARAGYHPITQQSLDELLR
jgi:leukotriene-A4 hydrolase